MLAGSPVGPPVRSGRHPAAGVHALVSLLVGVVVGAPFGVAAGWRIGLMTAWLGAGLTFLVWIWWSVWNLDADATERLAQREDSSRLIRDLVLLVAAGGSLVTVALVIFRAKSSGNLAVALGVASVIVSWTVVHTVFALTYARLYYTRPVGGIDFKQTEAPAYQEFAYFSFTTGMTFQVADTDVKERTIRMTVLRHAVTSFFLGAVILAITVNIVAGLSH